MILNLEKDGHVARVLPGGRVQSMNAAQRSEIRHVLASEVFEVSRTTEGTAHRVEVARPRDPEWLALMGCAFRRRGWEAHVDLRPHRLDPEPEDTEAEIHA